MLFTVKISKIPYEKFPNLLEEILKQQVIFIEILTFNMFFLNNAQKIKHPKNPKYIDKIGIFF